MLGCSTLLGVWETHETKNNMNEIDISKLDKAAVLAALYNASHPLGMGFLHFTPADMTHDEAAELLKQAGDRPYFDYLKGRVMKIDLSRDKLRTGLYDRDNGEGAAAAAIAHLLVPA